MSQNINGIPATGFHYKSQEINNLLCQGKADAWMLQETGICWAKVNETHQWAERVKTKGSRLPLNFGYNKTNLNAWKSSKQEEQPSYAPMILPQGVPLMASTQ
jgi:hypothetical protein